MANHVDIKALADLIGDETFDMNWFSYIFSGGWGSRLTRYERHGAARGILTTGIGNEVSISKVYKKLQNNDFSDIAGFFVAMLCFFGEKIYEKLEFVEKIPKNSINGVVSALKCPEKYKNEVYEICHTKYDFIAFLRSAYRLEKTNFDLNSAIAVYKLQGDAVIFRLLCQIFYVNKGVDGLCACLINDLPIELLIDVSDYLSGCHFPVAVCPKIDEFSWQENQNGWFLYGKYKDEWRVVDVAGVGRLCLGHYPLANRLNYIGGGGKTIPYRICWNWGEIIDAYHYFESDLLVRDLKNDIFTHYWFNFGLKSKLNVRFRDGFINVDKNLQILPKFQSSLITVDRHYNAYLIVDLEGDFIDYCAKNDVFYSDLEIFDWFEIGKMLK